MNLCPKWIVENPPNRPQNLEFIDPRLGQWLETIFPKTINASSLMS